MAVELSSGCALIASRSRDHRSFICRVILGQARMLVKFTIIKPGMKDGRRRGRYMNDPVRGADRAGRHNELPMRGMWTDGRCREGPPGKNHRRHGAVPWLRHPNPRRHTHVLADESFYDCTIGICPSGVRHLVDDWGKLVSASLEGRFTQGVNLQAPRSEGVSGARGGPLMTVDFRPFWHGDGTDALLTEGQATTKWSTGRRPLI